MIRTRPPASLPFLWMACALCLGNGSCQPDDGDNPPTQGPVEVSPAEVVMRRLTSPQYRHAIQELLGEGLALPTSLEPDTAIDGLLAVGASVATLSGRGVELYEAAARSLSTQVMESPQHRQGIIPCEPAGVDDPACLAAFIQSFGRRAWRRPLTPQEIDALVDIGAQAATTLDDFHAGAGFALSALLQSPYFLYRIELGEPDPERPELRRYTSTEMASRLSFFLWNTTPDEALLSAAEAGELTEPGPLKQQAERLLEDPRAVQAVRAFFSEWLHLAGLERMSKDPTIFTHHSAELGKMAREETLRLAEHVVLEKDADLRDFFTTRTSFVNRRLAALYNVRAPTEEGFGIIELPEAGQRRGFLGQVSFLGLHSHAVTSSPTQRGVFVREALLCDPVPPPPADLNTAIPPAMEGAKTLRERLTVHMEDPACSGCHRFTDIIGLGFEHFDGIGRYRATDEGTPIDPSGDLDGIEFSDARELQQLIATHPSLSECAVRKLYSYAVGHGPSSGEVALVRDLTRRFDAGGRRLKQLMLDIVLSEGFRRLEREQP